MLLTSRLSYYLYGILMFTLLWAGQALATANHRTGLHLQLSNKTVDIRENDIEELQIAQTGPESASVMLKLNAGSADQLYKLTEKAIGETAVWVWNGRVVAVQTLRAPISQDLTVHNLTIFEAENFKQKVNK